MIDIVKGEGRTIEAVQLLRPEVGSVLIVTSPEGTNSQIMKSVRNTLKDAFPHVGILVANKHFRISELSHEDAIKLLRKLSEVV